MTEEQARQAVRDAMGRAKEAWREYHVGRKVSSWELMERLEGEEALETTLSNGLMSIDLSFSPIFKWPSVKVWWWEHPASWARILMRYDESGWDIHVECQGGESWCERMCFELVEEENSEKD